MQMNIELDIIVEICKGRRNEWGWMLYYTNDQGRKSCTGIYTDPAKLLVEIGHQLLGKIVYVGEAGEGTIRYEPKLEVVVYDDGNKKIKWSTQQAETEKKENERRAKTLSQMEK